MKIKVSIYGKDWDGSYIEKTYSPHPETIIKRMNYEWSEYHILMNPFDTIIATAMLKWYGGKAFFWRDRGLLREGVYGQVCEPADTNSNNCITPRVRLDIEVDGHDVCNNSELRSLEAAKELYDAADYGEY